MTQANNTATTKSNALDSTEYALVCGMEIHAELKTKSKMFCGCTNDPFGATEPNSHTCPVCLGMPGGLPVANKTAVEWTIKFGLALGCKISLFSKFDRKHYFYPDLPKGYQISQYDIPFCYDGAVQTSEGAVRIRRIHLEEDTGKLMHTTIKTEQGSEKVSLIDFNRSGVPLIEIVTEADIVSPTQASEYAKYIRTVLKYLDFGDCDMDQGGMRLEANVSLRKTTDLNPVGLEQDETNLPAYKVELKNINSFRFLEQAISYEMDRQATQLTTGETPIQETRGWDSVKNRTFSQRTKGDAADYRYMPDPDLPPIRFDQATIDAWADTIPPLPQQIIADWQAKYGVEERFGMLLAASQKTVNTLTEAFDILSTENTAGTTKITPNTLASNVVNKKITLIAQTSTASELLTAVKALHQTDSVSDEEINQVIAAVMQAFPDEAQRFAQGDAKLLNFFIGQTMRKLGKKVAVELVKEKLVSQTVS